jgi:cytochrome P450
MIDHPHLVFLNPKLAMGLITSDKAMILPKVSFLFKIFLQKFGEGLVFIEGARWRSRRKIISKAFTFDFLKELIPQIAEISDEIFDRMEMSNKAQGVHNKFRADLFKLGLELFSSVTVNGFMGMGAYL